ncbi:MAG: uroporphyrinogen-III synthase [Aestuariibacter sp.]
MPLQMESEYGDNSTTVVVRPEGACQETCEFLLSNGVASTALPLLNVLYHQLPTSLLLHALGDADVIVATSANILPVLHRHQAAIASETPVCTVGLKTAHALQNYFKRIVVPEHHNSEGIVDVLKKNPDWQKITLLKGQGGRLAIQQSMAAIGRIVRPLALYRRVPNNQIEPSSIRWQYVSRVIVTSVELVGELLSRCPVTQYPHIQWLVLSERIAASLQEVGIQNIIITDGTDNRAILKALNNNRLI